MYPRLIIVCIVGLVALTGCRNRASFTEFNSPNASISSIEPVAVRQATHSSGPFQRLEDMIYGSRSSSTPGETTVAGETEEHPIQYVDPTAPPYKTAVDIGTERESLPRYTLDTGDRIRVFVYGQPNLTRVYNVDGQGRISVPLVGSVLARGRTTRALEGVIKGGLERKFVKDAQVSIEVAVHRPFYIHGEVRTPGQFPYVYGMTVEAAIATAGGYSPRASERGIKVARTVDGSRDVIVVAPSDYVRPGDIIKVDERFF